MNGYLVIRLKTDAADWLPLDAHKRPLGAVQHGALEQAAAMAAERRVVVLVPSEHVLLTRVAVPGLRGARLRQAIPYALEDLVVGEVEALHCAIAGTDADGKVPVAAVERAQMDEWLARLREAGIRPDALVPDCLSLPWSEEQVIAAVDAGGARLLVRDGAVDGYACDPGIFSALHDARGTGAITSVALESGATVPPSLAGIPAQALTAGLLAWLAPQAVDAPLDLMQGDYRTRGGYRDGLRRWRVPGALAAALLVVAVAGWLAEYRAIASHHATLQAEIAERFTELVPGEPMVDPRAQIERRFGRTGGSTDLLAMLDVASEALAGMRQAELSALSYRPGTLEISVTAQRAEQLESLRARIETQGRFQVSIDAASSRGDRVEGRLTMRTGAP